MLILFIRHGEKEDEDEKNDEDLPLSADGKEKIQKLAEILRQTELVPEVYLYSRWRHAQDTAETLAEEQQGVEAELATVTALTPHTEEKHFRLSTMIEEAANHGIEIEKHDTIAFVGHEPRLSQLITRMTGSRVRPLNRGEAVVVEGESLIDLMRGSGLVKYRLPVQDFQEEQLRPKISSKITVATFLAGFTFTALFGLLNAVELRQISCATDDSFSVCAISLMPAVAVFFLTVALALFIVSIYMLDSLSMPEGFWVSQTRPGSDRGWPKSFRYNRRHHGPLYAYMKRTWELVFTPGVVAALLGFTAILFFTRLWPLIVLCILLVLAIFVYYRRMRPKLGTD